MSAATYQGKPCKNGHKGVRYVNEDRCVDCIAAQNLRLALRRKAAKAAELPEPRNPNKIWDAICSGRFEKMPVVTTGA